MRTSLESISEMQVMKTANVRKENRGASARENSNSLSPIFYLPPLSPVFTNAHRAPAPSTLPVILLSCYRCSLTTVEVVLTPTPDLPSLFRVPRASGQHQKTPEVLLSKIARGQNKPMVAIGINTDSFVMEHNKWTTNNK